MERPAGSQSIVQSLQPTNFIPQGDHSSDGGGTGFINQKLRLSKLNNWSKDFRADFKPVGMLEPISTISTHNEIEGRQRRLLE